MRGETTYTGLCLIAECSADVADMQVIVDILNRHNIKVGGYDSDADAPEIERGGGLIVLDLGR